ncbi:MAG: TRAP transporter substrate-binding protein DctP [Pseudomonadota bacterium]
MKSKYIKLFLIIFFTLSISMLVQPKTIIKLATVAPDGSAWMKITKEYTDAVEKATNNRIGFKLYPGGVAGDERAVLRKMRFNQINAAGFTGVGLGDILPEVRILDSPMLFRSYAEVDFVLSKFTKDFESEFLKKGFVLLGWTEVGFIYFFSQLNILTKELLSETKMWTWEGDPVSSAMLNSLNVKPIPLAVTDVLTSLQTNLIDSVYTGPAACVALQWFARIKYILDVKLADAVGAILISEKTYNMLSKPDSKILKDLGFEYMKKLTKISRKDNDESLSLMQGNGITLLKPTEKDKEFFVKAGQQARQALVGKMYSKELLNRFEKTLEEFRKSGKR